MCLSDTKRCISCEREKPLDAFYEDDRMADGRLKECKVCKKSGTRAASDRRLFEYKPDPRKRWMLSIP
jgi:hypothetical protein